MKYSLLIPTFFVMSLFFLSTVISAYGWSQEEKKQKLDELYAKEAALNHSIESFNNYLKMTESGYVVTTIPGGTFIDFLYKPYEGSTDFYIMPEEEFSNILSEKLLTGEMTEAKVTEMAKNAGEDTKKFKEYLKTMIQTAEDDLAETKKWISYYQNSSADSNSSSGSATIAGVWTSDWGPVTISVDSATGKVTGSWDQGDGKIGKITDGTFDSASGILKFSYYESWYDLNGSAQLTLSSDGKKLEGTWTQPGNSGIWIMSR